MTFEEWMTQLEAIMDEWASEHGARPYGDGSLAVTTGLDCWRGFFDGRYSPREAFDEDQSCWD